MLLSKNDKLLFIGDSITDVGRARPIGDGHGESLGKGYVSLVDAWLHATHPDMGIRVVNMGTSGNTVRHLAERWQTDVIDQKPDWLAIMIGINDVWRHFDRPTHREIHVGPEEYEQTLEKLVDQTRPLVKGIILATPYFLETSTDDPMRRQMDRYGRIVEKIAKCYRDKIVSIDTQAAFGPFLASQHSMSIAWDRVHPNLTGHVILAKAFVEAIEVGEKF